jgi:hypothetical protein
MTDTQVQILLAICVLGGGVAVYDLVSGLRTGKAPGRWGVTITRQNRPTAFRTWMIAQCVILALFFAGLIWSATRI